MRALGHFVLIVLLCLLSVHPRAQTPLNAVHALPVDAIALRDAFCIEVSVKERDAKIARHQDPVGDAVTLSPKPNKVTLPDHWDKAVPMRSGLYRYDITIPASYTPKGVSALFIPRAGNSLWVELNGLLVGEFGTFTPPYPNYSGYPLKVLLPEHLFLPGEQQLSITVAGNEYSSAGLSEVYVGSQDAIDPMLNSSTWSQVNGVWMVSGTAAVIGLMSLLLWVRIRQPLYLYFALASFIWSFRLMMPLIIAPFLPPKLWTWLYFVLFSVYITCVCLFSMDVISHTGKGIRNMLWAFLLMSLLLITFGVTQNMFQLRQIVLVLSIVVSAVASVVVFRSTMRQPEMGRILLCTAAVVVLLAGTRDYFLIQATDSGYAIPTWGRYASIMFMFVLAWIILERFSRAMQSYQTSARFYELQFARKQSELEATYDHLRGAEKRQAVEDERRRIMREMHDGLGSALVTAMSLIDRKDSKQNDLGDALNNCMGELRMAIDALQPHENDLLAALGTLRARITPALEKAGMKLKWDVEQIPAIDRLTPEATLHLYRFVQEAISNAIKHSEATELTLRTNFDWKREWVNVMIDDNGKGWKPFAPGTRKGGGSDSLRARAHALGGIARIMSLKPGTRVQLSFPRGTIGELPANDVSMPESGFVSSYPTDFGPSTQPMKQSR
jgi:signal transduction histidine kinase